MIITDYYNQLQWFDMKRGHIFEMIVDSSSTPGTFSPVYNSKLFIRLKNASLDYVYKHHTDYVSPDYPYILGSKHPYLTPYNNNIHRFDMFIASHIETDMSSMIILNNYRKSDNSETYTVSEL